MATERLQINPIFFNKLDSLYKGKGKGKKITTNPTELIEQKTIENPKVKKSDTFGSTPISVISENTKKKYLQIPDNTQTSNKNVFPILETKKHKKEEKGEIINFSSNNKEFEIIEDQILKKRPAKEKYQRQKFFKRKRKRKIFRQKYNNSFHLYDVNNSIHIVAKLDKKNPLYNKIIDLPYQDLINITYYNKCENKYLNTYSIICLMICLMICFICNFNCLF